jgi:hypothetical protein
MLNDTARSTPFPPRVIPRSLGRGLALMRCYLDWLRFNDGGNRVTFGKRRSVDAGTGKVI